MFHFSQINELSTERKHVEGETATLNANNVDLNTQLAQLATLNSKLKVFFPTFAVLSAAIEQPWQADLEGARETIRKLTKENTESDIDNKQNENTVAALRQQCIATQVPFFQFQSNA